MPEVSIISSIHDDEEYEEEKKELQEELIESLRNTLDLVREYKKLLRENDDTSEDVDFILKVAMSQDDQEDSEDVDEDFCYCDSEETCECD